MLTSTLRGLLVAPILALALPGAAHAVLQDFDAFSDAESLTSQIAGLVFSNATVLTAGLSLNDSEFPPLSGANVVFDSAGEITIDFDAPLASIGAYFTYVVGLSFSAYDIGLNLLATDASGYVNNSALAGEVGSQPNEFLGVISTTGIRRIVITGDPFGGSFVMDDLTYELAQVGTAADPATLPLVFAGLAGGLFLLRIRSRR